MKPRVGTRGEVKGLREAGKQGEKLAAKSISLFADPFIFELVFITYIFMHLLYRVLRT